MSGPGRPETDPDPRRRERLHGTIALALVLVTWGTLYWARFVSDWFRDRGWVTAVMIAVFAVAALAVAAALAASFRRAGRRPGAEEIAVLALFAALYAAAVVPRFGRPEEALHFVQYGAVGGFAFAALDACRRRLLAEPGGPGRRQAGPLRHAAAPAAGAFLFTLAAGWADEGIQAILPNRYYDLRDVAFNAAGGALAIAAMASLAAARRRAETRAAGRRTS